MNGDGMSLDDLQKMKQIEEMKKQILSSILSREAYERLARVRAINPELAGNAELYLLQMHQAGKLKERVPDVTLKEVLKALSQDKGFRIRRA